MGQNVNENKAMTKVVIAIMFQIYGVLSYKTASKICDVKPDMNKIFLRLLLEISWKDIDNCSAKT